MVKTLQRIESRNAIDTAHNGRQVIKQIFTYAIQTGQLSHTNNPAQYLGGALKPKNTKHHPAITTPAQFGRLLAAIDKYSGTHIVRSLLKLCPLLFQRPGEMIAMEWEEIDFKKCIWMIPGSKMKMGLDHFVPLSKQAKAVLKDVQPLTGYRKFVFPSQSNPRTGHASNGTINRALNNMGFDTKTIHSAHGFRASARTLLDEELGERIDLIEHQLAHQVQDQLGRAYNRTSHLKDRITMMQRWADYLDDLRLAYRKEKH